MPIVCRHLSNMPPHNSLLLLQDQAVVKIPLHDAAPCAYHPALLDTYKYHFSSSSRRWGITSIVALTFRAQKIRLT